MIRKVSVYLSGVAEENYDSCCSQHVLPVLLLKVLLGVICSQMRRILYCLIERGLQ